MAVCFMIQLLHKQFGEKSGRKNWPKERDEFLKRIIFTEYASQKTNDDLHFTLRNANDGKIRKGDQKASYLKVIRG